MWIRKISVFSVGFAASSVCFAQGLFNFDEIPGVSEEPAIRVDINSATIGFFRNMLGATDPATADILRGLRGIQLRVYHGTDNPRQLNQFIENVAQQLNASGWSQMMSVQDEDSNVRFHVRMTEEEASGLTVMVFDDGEAIFISIDGSVSAEDLGKVMSAFPMMGPMPMLSFPPQSASPPQQQGNSATRANN